MGLMVSAQIIRELIADGEYLVECIEQRERGKVAVAFALRSRAQPYSIQIETMDNKLGGLFRALLDEQPAHPEKPAQKRVGGQPIQVVEVESVPADASKGLRRRNRRINSGPEIDKTSHPASGARSSTRQLVLMPQEGAREAATTPAPSKRRRAAPAATGMKRSEPGL
jgi:hypothetical protein